MFVRVPAVRRRSGTAAVEMAIVFSFILFPTLAGVLEVGRIVQLHQIISNAAREGARLAAQGQTISTSGTRVQIRANTGNPSVQNTAYQYLIGSGLTELTSADVTVTFTFTAPRSDGAAATESSGCRNILEEAHDEERERKFAQRMAKCNGRLSK